MAERKNHEGLEDIVVGESAVSSINDDVLTYRGININELADHATFEEIIYLLWYGKLPTEKELSALSHQLILERELPTEVLRAMQTFPRTIHPMDALRTSVSLLALYDPDVADMSFAANQRKAIRLTAKMPTIVANFQHFRNGEPPVSPLKEGSEARNFLYMLYGKEPDEVAISAMDKALVLHADHELNASTFSARVTASTLSDMHSAIVAAICTLKGPLHGGANEAVMKMLLQIGSEDKVEEYLRDQFARKEKVMGFGHRVYKHGDPRARYLREMSRRLGELNGDLKWYNISVRLEEIVKTEKGILPNTDFFSATVYYTLHIPIDLFTPIFAISRVTGWLAHLFEQYADNRLIRPRADYIGPTKASWIPLSERK